MILLKHISFPLLCFFLLFTSCKKNSDPINNILLEQYFETNVLNRNFIVSLATDNNTDLTPNYSGYVFVLLKTDFYHGPLKATKGSNVYTGTWSCNADYGKLDISLPASPSEFTFLKRAWRFTSKDLPTLKLSPWGSSAPIVLHMYRQ